jgi:hypothetical protein
MQQIVVLLMDLGQNLVFALMLIVELQTLAPSWTISYAPAHLTFAFAWEKWVVLNQI